MNADVFSTKSIFLWNVPSVENGDPDRIAQRLIDVGFESVAVKVQNGPNRYNLNWSDKYRTWGENVRPDLVEALHARGLKVIGWGNAYGYQSYEEGLVAADQVNRFGLDGFIWDQETTAEKQARRVQNANDTMKAFRANCQVPTAFNSWALWQSPKSGTPWHPIDMAKAWISLVDCVMPMMYWDKEGPTSALWWLENSMKQHRELTDLPIIPAGRAYNGEKVTAIPEALLVFAKTSLEIYGVPGITWWVMDQAANRSDLWSTLERINALGNGGGDIPEKPQPGPVRVKRRVQIEGTNLNIRLTPEIRNEPPGQIATMTNTNKRGGFGKNDLVEILTNEEYAVQDSGKTYHLVPAIVYVAKEYLEEC